MEFSMASSFPVLACPTQLTAKKKTVCYNFTELRLAVKWSELHTHTQSSPVQLHTGTSVKAWTELGGQSTAVRIPEHFVAVQSNRLTVLDPESRPFLLEGKNLRTSQGFSPSTLFLSCGGVLCWVACNFPEFIHHPSLVRLLFRDIKCAV